ncbi:MAG: 3-dehydroquinate synthase [Trueperella sp.]|nr:3-dehydroquinate synthase [Trueperella sp.]
MAPRAVFIGMPGVGKSTVGRAVARELGVKFADADNLIVKRAGKSIVQIFAEQGESGFRKLEEEVVCDALDHFSGVISLGGGAVLHPAVQQRLTNLPVILIEVSDAELVRRVTKSRTVRPILTADPAGTIARLRQERAALYHRLAAYVVHSDSNPMSRVVADALAVLRDPSDVITVAAGQTNEYPVIVGNQLASQVVRFAAQYAKVMVVHAPQVSATVAAIHDELRAAEIPVQCYELPAGEASKTNTCLAELWHAAGEFQLGRDGAVIAIGGGATTDVAGFFAATWLRGIPVIQVPTTLLAMVDAAVGGKTGINTDHGKNLVGAFHSPRAVICDMSTLATLPIAELRAGMGEIVKCGFIRDREILNVIAKYGRGVINPTHHAIRELVTRAVQVKAEVVSADFRESGLREILNYGHTFAHAVELDTDYRVRHGEAVAIGCVFAAAIAEAAGIAAPGHTDLHRQAFAALGLPVNHPGADRAKLENIMYSDKKVRDGKLRFVVLRDIAQPEIMISPGRAVLDQAFAAVGA